MSADQTRLKAAPCWCWAGGVAVLCTFLTTIAADPDPNPYNAIAERNIFRLKPAPAVPAPDPPKLRPVTIRLTGITTILGDKRVLLKTPSAQDADGVWQPERSYILTVGQREGQIEVLDIDEKAGNVTFNNAGVVVTLNIDRDGPGSPGARTPLVTELPPPPAAFPHRGGGFKHTGSATPVPAGMGSQGGWRVTASASLRC